LRAAAIHCGASIIVTANLRDFPAAALAPFGVEACHPDAFVLGLIANAPSKAVAALRELRLDLRKLPLTAAALLAIMKKQSLTARVDALGGFADEL